MRSWLPHARSRPSAEKATERTRPLQNHSQEIKTYKKHLPDRSTITWTVDGFTGFQESHPCPSRVRWQEPEDGFQILTLSSSLPDARSRPSADKATEVTQRLQNRKENSTHFTCFTDRLLPVQDRSRTRPVSRSLGPCKVRQY